MGEEEPRVYGINAAVNIDEAQFQALLNAYVEALKQQNKMNLASALQDGRSSLHHNRWQLELGNELLVKVLEPEREPLLIHMRSQLGVPDFFLEVKVVENQDLETKGVPYTNEEKLKEMARKNPSLRKLQEIFKTRIIYS